MSGTVSTIKNIEQQIANEIKGQTKAAVEFTMRGANEWTISGDTEADVNTAVEFMIKHIGWKLEAPVEFDDDTELAFAYLIGR